MARTLLRSAEVVPELFDREVFLKKISPSKYELWVGTESGTEVKVSSDSSVADVEGLQTALDALSTDLTSQLDTLNAIISDLYGAGSPGSGVPSNESFVALDTFNTLASQVTALSGTVTSLSGVVDLKAFIDDLTDLSTAINGSINGLQVQIDAANAQILLRAMSATVDDFVDDLGSLTTRVTAAETAITQNSTDILLRATKVELETVETGLGDLTTRVTAAEASIGVNADEILLRATKTELETLETSVGGIDTRLIAAEASISVQATEIASKVSTSTFTTFLNGDFDNVLTRISSAETAILQKADSVTVSALQTAFDSLGDTVGENSAEIQVLSTRISSQVTGTIIGNVDGNLTGTRTTIPVKLGIPVRLLDGDLIKIVNTATGIATTFTVDSVDPVAIGATVIPIVSATVTASDNDVVVIDGIQILSRIDQFGNQISSMVTQTYVDAQVSLLQTQITQTESDILLQAASLGAGNKIGVTGNTTGTTVSLSSALVTDLKEGDVISIVTQPSNAVAVRTVAADANAGATSFTVTSSVTSDTGGGVFIIKPGGKSLIAQINVAPGAVSILAEKINLSGFVTFSGFADAFNTNVTTIDGGKIATGSITANKLAAGVIEAGSIAAGSITADKIAANAITADKILANAITSAKIAAGAITADKIAAGTITADKLAAGVVEAASIATGSITADKIAAGAVTADKLSVTGDFFVNAINAYEGVLKIAANKVALSGSLAVEGDVVVSAINSGSTVTKILWNRIETSVIQSGNWGVSAGTQFDLTNGTIRTGGSSAPKFSVGVDGAVTMTGATVSGAITAESGIVSGIMDIGSNPLNKIVINGGVGPDEPHVSTAVASVNAQGYLTYGFTLFGIGQSFRTAYIGTTRTQYLSVVNNAASGLGVLNVDAANNEVGFFGSSGTGKPTITGSKGGNTAITSLLTALANLGLITDSTT